ncbi:MULTISPECIES: calcium-binding protein [unclassified Anabaena]|uniref:calcium-binding protein n=1 Tax=unclassified Anabaena TaxID=2619674 RepID=UPI000830DC06|nr:MULTISPECIES: M10 family metallopeptidase C-terminal domain-containing protein [unclassified Anabaena]
MTSDTLFLQPQKSPRNGDNSVSNFVSATGSGFLYNFKGNPLGTSNSVDADNIIKGGVATAITEFDATTGQETSFSVFDSQNNIFGIDGAFQGNSQINLQLVNTFSVASGELFSFDFLAELTLRNQQIENQNAHYNAAKSKLGFLVVDISNPNRIQVLDRFLIRGELDSERQKGKLRITESNKVTIIDSEEFTGLDSNNGTGVVRGQAIGNYQRKFYYDTQIAVIQINFSDVSLIGDALIDNLGEDVIYGTISHDNLRGTDGADKMYGSLGDDLIRGKRGDDILEGGQGNDTLLGGNGNDKLHGSWGDDILIGGRGNDVLVGGEGSDKFVFHRFDSLLKGELDVIEDFQVGKDQIVFQYWGSVNPMSHVNITDTENGTLFQFNVAWNQGAFLIKDVHSSQITPDSIAFA